eukprot:scpid80108/ scgid12908/ 
MNGRKPMKIAKVTMAKILVTSLHGLSSRWRSLTASTTRHAISPNKAGPGPTYTGRQACTHARTHYHSPMSIVTKSTQLQDQHDCNSKNDSTDFRVFRECTH